MAWSTPGYCTFTATTRPSGITARWTWPIDAAATGIGFQSRKSLSGWSPSSSRITPSARLGAIGGTSACRVASAAWASGGRPSAMKESIWPAFMMAPFIPPSTSATSWAVRMANCSSSRARRSSVAWLPRTLTTPHWAARRALRRQMRAWRSSRTRRPSSSSRWRTAVAVAAVTATAPATPAAATAADRRARRVNLGAAKAGLALGQGLVVEAEAGRGQGVEAGFVDGLAARLAHAVGAGVEAAAGRTPRRPARPPPAR